MGPVLESALWHQGVGVDYSIKPLTICLHLKNKVGSNSERD